MDSADQAEFRKIMELIEYEGHAEFDRNNPVPEGFLPKVRSKPDLETHD